MPKTPYIIAVVLLIIGIVAGYVAGYYIANPATTITITTTSLATQTTYLAGTDQSVPRVQTVTITPIQQIATTTLTVTKTEGVAYTVPQKIKAAWIYVGPVGDFGWSYMHDVGRRVVAELYKDWLETTYVENVQASQSPAVIDDLVRKGYTVIFTTSFDFMDQTYEKAQEYRNVMFFHCSGYKRLSNMGTYFADLYQIYYLNGLMAGALTKTGKIGYVAAHTIPEVVRHINAFAIGAKEVGEQLGKNITVYVIEIGAWFDPDKAKAAAETLVNQFNVDVLAFTEDSTAVVEYAESLYKQGKQIYVFSHYSPMYEWGPDVVVSGQLVRWEVIYADILAKIKAGIYTPSNLQNVDYWYLLNTGAVDLGAHVYPNGSVMRINPKFVPLLKSIMVKDVRTGETLSVYDLVMRRYNEMKEAPLLQPLQGTALTHQLEVLANISTGSSHVPAATIAPVFDPFTGPLAGY
ncbi:MAG: BMP family ABC transporter substrate-binding protein, partial [Ignisphaera sp.]